MKLWFEKGKAIRTVDVISMSPTDILVEYEQKLYHISPDTIGTIFFEHPYGFNSIGEPKRYEGTMTYEQLKPFFPEMGDASYFKFVKKKFH